MLLLIAYIFRYFNRLSSFFVVVKSFNAIRPGSSMRPPWEGLVNNYAGESGSKWFKAFSIPPDPKFKVEAANMVEGGVGVDQPVRKAIPVFKKVLAWDYLRNSEKRSF